MDELSRRAFLARFGGVVVTGATLSALPELLARHGMYDQAHAAVQDFTDTYHALAAFWWPGDDAYSVAQGVSESGPGAVAANAGPHLAAALDFFVPAPDDAGANDDTLPLSQVIAISLDTVALTINPLAAVGTWTSPYANLSWDDKAAVWERLETDTQNIDSSSYPPPFTDAAGVLQFVFGVIPGFVQFFAFSEIDVFDAGTRTLTSRPVGWDHAGYAAGHGTTLPEGWDDLIGFYGGRTAVNGSDGTGEVLL